MRGLILGKGFENKRNLKNKITNLKSPDDAVRAPRERCKDATKTQRKRSKEAPRMLLNTFSKLKFTMLSNLLLMGFNTWEFLDKTIKNMIYVSKCLKSKYHNL